MSTGDRHKRTSQVDFCSTQLLTRKRRKAQRVARSACAKNATVYFRLAMLLPPIANGLKNQHIAYISLHALTTHANEPQGIIGYWTKVHQICSCSNFFIDSLNATICVAIRPAVVE